MSRKIEVGGNAPQFTLEGTDGAWSLSDAKGSALVIYFYPRDNTSGCTQEGLDFSAVKWPAAFRYPIAALKVNFIQRHVPNVSVGSSTHLVVPNIGRTAKLPAASLPENLFAIAVI